MDTFGTTVFTGGAVLILGSFFSQVFELMKKRKGREKSRFSPREIVLESLRVSPMQVVVGGAVF